MTTLGFYTGGAHGLEDGWTGSGRCSARLTSRCIYCFTELIVPGSANMCVKVGCRVCLDWNFRDISSNDENIRTSLWAIGGWCFGDCLKLISIEGYMCR